MVLIVRENTVSDAVWRRLGLLIVILFDYSLTNHSRLLVPDTEKTSRRWSCNVVQDVVGDDDECSIGDDFGVTYYVSVYKNILPNEISSIFQYPKFAIVWKVGTCGLCNDCL